MNNFCMLYYTDDKCVEITSYLTNVTHIKKTEGVDYIDLTQDSEQGGFVDITTNPQIAWR